MPKTNFSTRANIPAPKRKTLPSAPQADLVSDNMQDERLAPMTFNMPRDWHTRFKMTAAMRGISMKELLVEAFETWERAQKD